MAQEIKTVSFLYCETQSACIHVSSACKIVGYNKIHVLVVCGGPVRIKQILGLCVWDLCNHVPMSRLPNYGPIKARAVQVKVVRI